MTVEPTRPALAAHYEPLINGEFRSLATESFPALDAATGRQLATLTRGRAAEIDAAVAAARAARDDRRRGGRAVGLPQPQPVLRRAPVGVRLFAERGAAPGLTGRRSLLWQVRRPR